MTLTTALNILKYQSKLKQFETVERNRIAVSNLESESLPIYTYTVY